MCHGWAGFRDCHGGAPSIETSITKCTAVRAAAASGICFVRESSQHARAPVCAVHGKTYVQTPRVRGVKVAQIRHIECGLPRASTSHRVKAAACIHRCTMDVLYA